MHSAVTRNLTSRFLEKGILSAYKISLIDNVLWGNCQIFYTWFSLSLSILEVI